MFIVSHRNWFYAFTGLLVAASIASIAYFGLAPGTDFTGGTLIEVTYPADRPTPAALDASLHEAGIVGYSLREAGEQGYILRAGVLAEGVRADMLGIMSPAGSQAIVTQLTEVGPTIGAELRAKAWVALALVLLCILLFIAFAFRSVSRPVSSWVYGIIALVTLVHDVIVPVGFYAYLGHIAGAQIDTLFVTAVLTILGFSIHDTIVVFDRVRENLRINHDRGRKEPFAEVAGRSLGQTFVRSINTSMTVIITLAVLYVIGPASTKLFALTLLVGIAAGTFSSIFLATPLLVTWERFRAGK
ncbi:protein translocase subunit SecF [Candidatus Kaiserbacteria bacterium]|nr:protein translocase subunit SecF [Candidatus Kaiserbacteria bacterium]